MTQVTQSSPAPTLALAWFLGHLGHGRSMTQMTQKPVALVLERTPSPWCSSARTGSHVMTQMTQRPRVARTGA
jgi:hypothetical protein